MGQNQCGTSVTLSCFVDSATVTGNNPTKLERFLRSLSDRSDEAGVLSEWEKNINKKTKSPLERWGMLGYAIRCLERWGKHRLMIAYAVRQIELAHEINNNAGTNGSFNSNINPFVIVADSYLNLAKANLLLSRYQKSLDYARKCLNFVGKTRGSDCDAMKLSGHAYLCKGRANLGLSNYTEALGDFEATLSMAHGQHDKPLECSTCCAMGSLYLQVKDYEKATFFPIKASEILQEYGKGWSRRYRTTTQICLAEAYRKLGKVDEAMDVSEDAMRSALEDQDRLSQAYCMLCFADVHRVRKDEERAIPRYEAAGALMVEIGDRYGHSLVAMGKAKAYLKAKEFPKALSQYETALGLAEAIANKMACMRIHGEMAILYQRMSNQELARKSTFHYHQLLESMDLFCGVCVQPIGEKHEQLEALPCSHLFHLRCVSEQGLLMLGKLACPTCRRHMMKPVTL